MKTHVQTLPNLGRLVVLVLLSTLNSQLSTANAQGTAFTYQGRLTDNASPATGIYDLRFTIYDLNSGGSVIGGPTANGTVGVSNGLFAITLDFGAGVFTGPARWLEIGVRTNGSVAAYSILSSRQALTPSPYAIFAGTASNVVNGSVVKSLNGLKDSVTLAAGSNVTITPNGNSLTIAAAGVGGSGIWSVNGNNTYYNAGNVGIGTTTPSNYGHGGTARILEINNGGTTLHSQAHLMLYSGVNSLMDSAMGTVTWAQPGGMAAFVGAETRSTTSNSPAAKLVLGTRNIGDVAASTKMVITENGSVGIGTTAPSGRLQVAGDWDGEQGALHLSGHRPTIRFTGDADTGNQSWLLHLGGDGPGALEFFRRTGPGAYSPVLALNPNSDVLLSPESGNVGIGKANPSFKLDVFSATSTAIVGRSTAVSGIGVYGESSQYNGVRGLAHNANHGGVVGVHDGGGIAVYGTGATGVLGDGTSVGVYGRSAAGAAVHAEGNATQARDKGGFVKAMAYVNPFLPAAQYVVRCFNSQIAGNVASTAPCGIQVTRTSPGEYYVDFGFKVDDRFVSVAGTEPVAPRTHIGSSFGFVPGYPNQVRVTTFLTNVDTLGDDAAFMIIIY